METKLFSDIFTITTIYIPLEQIIFNMTITTLIALGIAWLYKRTYTGIIYSKNFNITLILTAIVTALQMMVIRSNMAFSLGLVGAASIIRFRSSIKDARDIGFLFWAMSAGLAAGTGNHLLAIIGSLSVTLLMILLYKFTGEQSSYILIVKGKTTPENELDKIFQTFSYKYKLKMKNEDNTGYELIYEIALKKQVEDNLLNHLKETPGIQSIHLLSHNGELIN